MSVITDDDSQTVVPRNQSTSMSDSSGDDLQNGTFLDKENDDSFESSFDTQKVDKLDKNLKNANIEENQPHAENIHKISSLQTYALMINFIIGTGVFGLPYAVESAGIGLSFIIVVFFYSLSVLTAVWVLENMARASGVMESYRRSRNTETPINELGFEVFNYARVGAIFFGKIGRGSAVIVISMFCYGALWAYTSVFSSSVTLIMWKYPLSSFGECGTDMSEWKLFDKCHISYLLGIVLFGCIVVPLSLIGVTEQRILQNFFNILEIL
ncbi:Amino acid transporter [Entamoeba marina]